MPRLPNVISATTERVDDDAQGEERQTLRHVVHMVRLLFFRILVPAFCGTAPQAGPGRETYEKQTSRQPDTQTSIALIFARTPPPPLFPHLLYLPASPTKPCMPSLPIRTAASQRTSRTPEIGVVSTMSPRRKGIMCCLPRWECSPGIVTTAVADCRQRATARNVGHTVSRVAGVIHRGIGSHNDCGTADRTSDRRIMSPML